MGQFDDLIEQAKAARIEFEWYQPHPDLSAVLVFRFQAGSVKKPMVVDGDQAEVLRKIDFARLVHIEGYAAIYDREAQVIEAMVDRIHLTSRGYLQSSVLEAIARGRNLREPSDELSQMPAVPERLVLGETDPDSWRMDLNSPNSAIVAELSRVSLALLAASPGMSMNQHASQYPASLKLRNVNPMDAGEALALLEGFAGSLFFELDCRYGVDISLERDMWPFEPALREPDPDKVEMRYPKNRYSAAAVELYMYGRTVEAYPLFQFLAYYQVLEHFFPAYADQEILKWVRRVLRDPSFDLEDGLHMGRVLGAFRESSRKSSREIDQLKLLLADCVDEEELRAFINQDPARRAFLENRNGLQGVEPLVVGKRYDQPLAEQVAKRVYAIRNRIVHAKDDGGGMGAAPLLPTSTEARRLSHDVALGRFLARRALIGNSHPARW
ncbi:hypothetical protein [Dactylosporangium sp. CA-092794]|uniref:hypothetical protein n=1 Tax=Dactylosporangium sp. CA-092794 TaxID=3239929 RepID=UPI003D93D16F